MTTPTIGIACHSFRTDGGMGRYVQLLAEGLLNLGIHPTVITKKSTTPSRSQRKLVSIT